MRRSAGPWVLGAVLLGLAWHAWFVNSSVFPFRGLVVGQAAPAFTAQRVAGGSVGLSEIGARQPLVLTFWTTWCAPCFSELRDLAGLKQAPRMPPFRVAAVNVRERAEAVLGPLEESVHEHLDELLLDPEGEVAREYFVGGFPTTVVLDSRFRVVEVFEGYSAGQRERMASAIIDASARSHALRIQ